VDQRLLPKDCLPAAAAAQRSPRSAETLFLKHLPAAPGRPNQCQKTKKARLWRAAIAISRQICAVFFLRARCALEPLAFRKFGLLGSFFFAFAFFSAPLRAEKPCFLPLFSTMAQTLQQAKSSNKHVGYPHLRAPRADVAKSSGKKSK